MSQQINYIHFITFIFLFIPLFLLCGCNSQDTPQKPPLPTQETDTPDVVRTVVLPRPEDWHMFMYDLQFSGKSPDKELKPPLNLLWQFKTGGPITASPVIANGILYIGSMDGKFYALNAKAWDIKWVYDARSSIRFSAVVWGDRVYFNTRDNKVYALDAKTGDMLWEFKTEGWMDSPLVVYDGTVYTGAYPSRIYMLDAFTGKRKSERQRTVTINGVEYGCSKAEFRPITRNHNAELWRSFTVASESNPAIANDFVYIGARDGKIHAFNMTAKTESWTYQVQGPVDATPAISDGTLYASSTDGSIYAFANASENTPLTADTRKHGVVTHDNAAVYIDKDGTTPIYHLNDGTSLPIIQTEQNWYHVELPNKETVWIQKSAFGQFEETDGVMFNTDFCGKPRIILLVEGAEYPYWSPNGELVAMLKRTDLSGSYWKADELWIMDKEGNRAKKLYAGAFYNPHVSWSLDSRMLAVEVEVENEYFIYIVDWELGRIKKLVKGNAPAWSPTANQLAFKRRDRTQDIVYRINSDGSDGREIARFPHIQSRYAYTYMHAPSWSPEGDVLAFEVAQDQDLANGSVTYAAIRLQNVEGERLQQLPTQHQRVRDLRWSADGTRLAYVLSGSIRQDPILDKRLHVAEITGSSINHQILKHTAPAWSPSGNRLAYLEREDCAGLQWKVWVYDFDSRERIPIARTNMKLTSIVWMPDGKHLCLWHTSDYLRNNTYTPANTKGWIVPVDLSL